MKKLLSAAAALLAAACILTGCNEKDSKIKIGVIRIYLTGYPPAQTQEGISSNPVPAQGNVAVSAAELSTEICPPDGLGFEEAVPF